MRQVILTDKAPAPIGHYSQAIRVGNMVYMSGQIALDPQTLSLVEGGHKSQVTRIFDSLREIAKSAGGNLDQITKLTVFVTDLAIMAVVNEAINIYFKKPYPARSAVQVVALPKGAEVEIEAIMQLGF